MTFVLSLMPIAFASFGAEAYRLPILRSPPSAGQTLGFNVQILTERLSQNGSDPSDTNRLQWLELRGTSKILEWDHVRESSKVEVTFRQVVQGNAANTNIVLNGECRMLAKTALGVTYFNSGACYGGSESPLLPDSIKQLAFPCDELNLSDEVWGTTGLRSIGESWHVSASKLRLTREMKARSEFTGLDPNAWEYRVTFVGLTNHFGIRCFHLRLATNARVTPGPGGLDQLLASAGIEDPVFDVVGSFELWVPFDNVMPILRTELTFDLNASGRTRIDGTNTILKRAERWCSVLEYNPLSGFEKKPETQNR